MRISAEKCSAGAQLCATNVIIHTKAPTNQTFTQIVFFQQVIFSRLKPGSIPARFYKNFIFAKTVKEITQIISKTKKAVDTEKKIILKSVEKPRHSYNGRLLSNQLLIPFDLL